MAMEPIPAEELSDASDPAGISHCHIIIDMTPPVQHMHVEIVGDLTVDDPFAVTSKTNKKSKAGNKAHVASRKPKKFEPMRPPDENFDMGGARDMKTPCPTREDNQITTQHVKSLGISVASPLKPEFQIPQLVAFEIWRTALQHGLDPSEILGDGGDYCRFVLKCPELTEDEWIEFCYFLSKERYREDRESTWIHLIV